MATSMASQRQIKGILKNKTPASSLVVASAEQAQLTFKKLNKKTQKWNEVNFLSTYHPADKDYRLMKTGIPNTLYHNSMAYAEDADSVGPNDLDLEEESSGDEENHLSPQELEKKRQFEMKRKLHSNEGLNIKFARLLISKDLHDDDDEDEGMSETAD
ncbi:protein phosphatase inhibitor 2-like isoform X2 [Mus pahari]|uniref:protein phosphatase inhibitor 2-like isoform X2 n=1 Tax=Mus pahari TaxID=10093 RepID=UPI000A30F409|nr:protein phosphatase inhibitor 2-like isoform X2 [Mus pahari]